MRLWSIHPGYLDSIGLNAVWREGLLAQKVLKGETRGYKNHSQIERFKNTNDPLSYIAGYLRGIAEEAVLRGYNYDAQKIGKPKGEISKIPVTRGQLIYELSHLVYKLENRDLKKFVEAYEVDNDEIVPHPLFNVIDGEIEGWERTR